jgi:hypothetical protein
MRFSICTLGVFAFYVKQYMLNRLFVAAKRKKAPLPVRATGLKTMLFLSGALGGWHPVNEPVDAVAKTFN